MEVWDLIEKLAWAGDMSCAGVGKEWLREKAVVGQMKKRVAS
jgi:hypothetical protein